MTDECGVHLDCTDCSFSGVVDAEAAQLPADVVRAHGRRFNHKVALESLDE